MSSENDGLENFTETAESSHLILQNVTILSELSSQLKKETKNGENYLNSLHNLFFQAGKDVSSLHQCVDSLLVLAKKLVFLSLQIVPIKDPNFKSLKSEADKLLNVLDEIKNDDEEHLLDSKCRQMEKSVRGNVSSKSLTIDEKYPEHCSKESLLDMNNIIGLPTVHEDVFADFYRPSRTLSSSSLKNMRKVQMCLKKVLNEEDAGVEDGRDTNELFKPCTKVDCGCSTDEENACLPLTVSTGTNPIQILGHIQEEPY